MRVQLCLANAQSNEKGSGDTPDRNCATGAPLCDPIGPYGTSTEASMWPRLAELAGLDGHWIGVRNTARSSSSGPHAWAGCIVPYATSSRFSVGNYVVAAGKFYKATASSAASINGTTGGSAPTWPASGTVIDGQITWTYRRASTAADTDYKVFREGDAEFDPNSYISGAHGFCGLGYDKNVVLLQNGQEDSTRQTSAAVYRDALLSTGDYFAARGYIVMVGYTSYSPGEAAWADSVLIPVLDEVLAARPSWKRGANLRQVLGDLPTSPALGIAGLKSDALHMNNAALRLGAAAVYASMQSAGII